MCCSSRKGSRTYQYTETSSPWNNRFLYGLWASEVILGVFVCIFGAACLPYQYRYLEYDDGIAEALYYILLFMVVGIVGMNISFVVLQYLWFRKHKLHPGFMLFMECFNLMVWLAIVALTLYSLIGWSSKWKKYEAAELMYIFASLPYVAHLWYSAVVYHRLRKNRRRSVDVEL